MENVEYFNYLGRMLTYDARQTPEEEEEEKKKEEEEEEEETLFTSSLEAPLGA